MSDPIFKVHQETKKLQDSLHVPTGFESLTEEMLSPIEADRSNESTDFDIKNKLTPERERISLTSNGELELVA